MNTARRTLMQRCQHPSQHKMALLTFAGLLAPVYFVPPALLNFFDGPRIFSVGAAVAVIVVLMTYVIMPILTFIAAGWLCGRSPKQSRSLQE